MIASFNGPYRFLSNFAASPIWVGGILYQTVEHAFQASKTTIPMERERISKLASPGMAKRAGRNVQLRDDWEYMKFTVMLNLVTLKFTIPDLRQKLLATGEQHIQEGNTWGDTYWGVNLKTGEGANHLGRILMVVRDWARDESKKAPQP